MRKSLISTGFILQNIISAVLCFGWLWAINYIPVVLPDMFAKAPDSLTEIIQFISELIGLILFVTYPITYIVTLCITLKSKAITWKTFLPAAQILVAVMVVLIYYAFS
jgi:hypothetical protein